MSEHLHNALHRTCSPIALEYYERSRALIFEKDQQFSKIEVRCQTRCDVALYQRSASADEVGDTGDAPGADIERAKSDVQPRTVQASTQDCGQLRRDTLVSMPTSVSKTHAREDCENMQTQLCETARSWSVISLDPLKLESFLKV